MDKPFDELAKGLARGMSRRGALRQIGRLGGGLVGLLLAGLGTSRVAADGVTPYECTVTSYNHVEYTGHGPDADSAADKARDKCVRREGNPGFCQNPAVCEPIHS